MSIEHPHDKVIPFTGSEKGKKEQVAEMFDRISGNYDKVNRVLSARTDIGWRKKALKLLKKDRPVKMLDVATGTGDMAILANRILAPRSIIGIDISASMLEIGRKKIEKQGLTERIKLEQGDSETINYAQNSFDAVTAAFGVRNFENLEKGLAEMLRVLKPGGRIVILEFSKPRSKLISKFYNLYMKVVAPRVAGWFRQNKQAYHYLNESATAFPDRQSFIEILKKVGFGETRFTPLSFGICCIYSGRKPAQAAGTKVQEG
jgi:demethylmenaquinone methyltransferase/2-methoxy-6-polyprenyl-1,4-benzoquinol methylase